jgi:hypothetical protein
MIQMRARHGAARWGWLALCAAWLAPQGLHAQSASSAPIPAPAATPAPGRPPSEWEQKPPKIPDDTPGRWRPGRVSRQYGVRLGASSDAPRTVAGMLWTHGVGDMQFGLLSTRYRDFAALGVGGSGLEGGIGTDFAMGIRPDLAAGQGPVLRAGLRAELFGNQDFYTSWLELPQLQLGYAWLLPKLRAELGGRAGEVLTGRFITPEGRRKINLHPDVGAYATLQLSVLRLDLEWIWVDLADSFESLQRAGGRLCIVVRRWAACADAQRWTAARLENGSVATQWLYLGASAAYIDEELR